MQFTVEQPVEKITLAILDGRLDIIGANEIDLRFSTVIPAKEEPVLIDLSRVSFLSSMGMRMLLGAAQALGRKGIYCAIVAPQPIVLEALHLAGLENALPIHPTLEEGIAAAKATARILES